MRLFVIACAALLAGCVANLHEPSPGKPSRIPVSFLLSGGFVEGGAPSGLGWSRAYHGNLRVFSSWSGSDANQGSLQTTAFLTPHYLHFFLCGFPSLPGISIQLVDQQTGQSLRLSPQLDPGFDWKMHVWTLPVRWRYRNVRLVVQDQCSQANGWIGISEISVGEDSLAFSLVRALYRSGLLVYSGCLFVIPGIALLLLMIRFRLPVTLPTGVAALLIGGSVAGYCVFGLYLISPMTGQVAALFVMSISFIGGLTLHRELFQMDKTLARELTLCACLVLGTSLLYNSLGFLYASDDGATDVASTQYLTHRLPADNQLPQLFAQRLFNGQSVLPTLSTFWHSSDRPPLQTAITLLETPLFVNRHTDLQYQELGVFLQTTFIVGIWVLLRAMKVEPGRIVGVLGFCMFSQFALLHTFYVWPKLLAATFCLVSMALWLPYFGDRANRREEPFKGTELVCSAMCAGLALQCHPGIAFTFIGLALVALLKRGVQNFKVVGYTVMIVVLILLPWKAYQTLYDPPGDALLKFYLAGVLDEQHSLMYCIIRSYRALTAAQLIENKVQNFKLLLTGPWLTGFVIPGWTNQAGALIESSFFLLSMTLGVLNVGLLLRALSCKRRTHAIRAADSMFLVAGCATAFWCLVMFETGSTVVHQGSFATVLLLFLSSAIYLETLAPKLYKVLFCIQVFALFPIFVFKNSLVTSPGTVTDSTVDTGMAVGATVCLMTLGWVATQLRRL